MPVTNRPRCFISGCISWSRPWWGQSCSLSHRRLCAECVGFAPHGDEYAQGVAQLSRARYFSKTIFYFIFFFLLEQLWDISMYRFFLNYFFLGILAKKERFLNRFPSKLSRGFLSPFSPLLSVEARVAPRSRAGSSEQPSSWDGSPTPSFIPLSVHCPLLDLLGAFQSHNLCLFRGAPLAVPFW